MEFSDFNKKIADQFPLLSTQLQIAARHVLDRPDDVALMSMRSLASSAGVHPSTMVRLAKTFGYESYQEFRAPFQNRLRVRQDGYLIKARNLQARSAGDEKSLTQEVLTASMKNLNETFEINRPEQFEAFAKTLARGRKIFVAGLRGVFPVSFFFYYTYSMFRDNAVHLDSHGATFADDLRNFTKDDVIFAISFDPYTTETVQAVKYAKGRGGTAVVMTDSLVSPLADGADQVLLIKTESPSFYHSVSAGMAAAEELITLLMAAGGESALTAIEESEEQLKSFNAYWHQNSQRKTRRLRKSSGKGS